MQRRTFIKSSSLTVISISAFGGLNWNGKNFEGDNATTTDILGPFYRPGAPLRSNLRLPKSNGAPIVLRGIIFKEDGKTPINNALVEIWHCDEQEVYDNASDDYNYRAAQKTKADGKYTFKSILPVPYKADPNDEASWRPAHIHMRVSVPDQQDLITQIYFKGGKYVETDKWSSSPGAVNRILPVSKSSSGESEIVFNVVMAKEFPLDPKVYARITGLYQLQDNMNVEFLKNDDLLFMKQNGWLRASLKYIGNNSFVGGIGYPKVVFELLKDGNVKVVIERTADITYTGTKFLKYEQ
ncbi:catechol 1,2-dioxygenase [Lacibacter luteus]|uniref:Catechol 1,2-dioxygenase n=1 Tax=Lacibacter luteus TaxID=2508719 RepID=A0A4Q1CJH7_9BACT|nr:catechol 1,2-dioxygenase [Lacibacter luteus]RXK60821.1 catechol 1,2-dioxygenase [Lacibacter luteus]